MKMRWAKTLPVLLTVSFALAGQPARGQSGPVAAAGTPGAGTAAGAPQVAAMPAGYPAAYAPAYPPAAMMARPGAMMAPPGAMMPGGRPMAMYPAAYPAGYAPGGVQPAAYMMAGGP